MSAPTFGLTLPPLFPVRLQVSLVQSLEWLGFDHVWLPDHLVFPDLMQAPDPWTVMAAAMAKTRRIVFGTAVTDAHRVHPAVLAQRLATMDQLSCGRLVLGLGSGEAMNLDPFGIPWNRRVGRLKEFIQVLRGLLDSEAPLDFEGEFFRLRGARLFVRSWRQRRIPLYLAALGPVTQRLAGQVADGWIPPQVPADFYQEYFEPIAASAREAGRDPAKIERVAHVVVALTDHPAPLLRLLQEHALGIIWSPVARRMGLDMETPTDLDDIDYISVNPLDAESLARYRERQRQIPPHLLQRFVFAGDVARIRQVIGGYIDAGATHIQITNASFDPTATFTLASQILPWFTRRKPSFSVRLAATAMGALRRVGIVRDVDPRKGLEWMRQQT